jgi:hypothetical protein
MRKLHWVSMVLLAAPIAFASACGGDDTSGGGTGGSTGTGGTTGTGGGDTGGSTGTGGGDTGGSTGTGGGDTGGSTGTGGTTDDGGTGGAATDDGGTGGSATTDDGGGGEAAAAKACTMDGDSKGKTCDDYCTAWDDNCAGEAGFMDVYANTDACMAACAAFNDSQLCCRITHAGLASGAADPHCFHAQGLKNNCQ